MKVYIINARYCYKHMLRQLNKFVRIGKIYNISYYRSRPLGNVPTIRHPNFTKPTTRGISKLIEYQLSWEGARFTFGPQHVILETLKYLGK